MTLCLILRTVTRSAAALLLLAVAACDRAGLPPEWHEEDGFRWHTLEHDGSGGPGFTSMSTRRTGIDFQNVIDPELALDTAHLTVGSGVALGDVTGNGLVDIYFARIHGPNVLYRNLGGWRFEEMTDEAGVALPELNSTGAAFADVNGNGHLDLIVTTLGGDNSLFLNDGTGRFTRVPDWVAADPGLGSTTVTLADVNGNGALDLYVTNYKVESASDLFLPYEDPGFRLTIQDGDSLVIDPRYRDHFRFEERDGEQIAFEVAHPDRLYLNDGEGNFEAVAWDSGRFIDPDGLPITREMDGFGLAARFYDVTGNGFPDLYVCNDFDDWDQFWLNDGTGTFHQAPPFTLRATSHASMAVDFADIDRNGRVDFFVADMLSADPMRRITQQPLHSVGPTPPGRIESRVLFQRNTLQHQRPDGTFAQISELAGVDASEWSWASIFMDVDLDGYEDLLVVNGFGRDMQNVDAIDRVTSLRGQITWREAKSIYPPLANRNMAFRNLGDLTFEDAGDSWGFGLEADVSYGMAVGDLSGDGTLDVVVNRVGQPARIYRNDATAPRLSVQLVGEAPNTRGVGAKVRVLGGPVPLQEREMTAGGIYLSHSDYSLTFATGDAEVLTIEVHWQSGRRSVVQGVRPNRRYEIHEAGAREFWDPKPFRLPGEVRDAPENGQTALFEDVSERLGHRHDERHFDDFARQPLLPFEVARLGPGVAWIDMNDSGRPDLVVSSPAGSRLAWMRNEIDRFEAQWLEAEAQDLDRSGLAVISDGQGGRTLLAGHSNWQVTSPDRLQATPSVLISSWELEAVIEGDFSSTGPLAVADLDGSGELDVFVGGRAIPTLYPRAASSRLFRGATGDAGERTFALHSDSETLFTDVGLVSDAVFSDVTGNGFPDLLLAIDWGTPRLYLNDGTGRLEEATDAWGLSELEGRWNGVATGDLTGDGRMDVILTSWGRNVRNRPREGRPLVLFHGDLDGSGGWSMVLAQSESEGGEPRPLERYERLTDAIPTYANRIPDVATYSTVGLDQILGRDLSTVRQLRAVTYDHMVLINRGDGFEAHPLPVEAQFAPAFSALIFDATGDGREDVFLSQNFFAVEPYTPRHDAGRGLLLRGDGKGGLHPVPGSESGIRIHGDQQGAAFADFDGDGRIDLAVSQNGAETRLLRNVGAEPGLRVRLEGPPGNPDGIGASIWLEYGEDARRGPAREIQSGSGYWSSNDVVQVLGMEGTPATIRVRWPGTTEVMTHSIPAGATTITIRWDGGRR